MNWDAAEAAIRAYLEAQWALGSYTDIPLVWENEDQAVGDRYMAVNIEGTFAEKGIYGGIGKRSSVEGGIIYFHCFMPRGTGKAAVTAPVRAITQMLELTMIDTGIYCDGGNPPSPADHGDPMTQEEQPGGNFYRCSGSVPFIVVGTR